MVLDRLPREGLSHRPRSKFWWMRYYAYDPVKQKRVQIQKSTGETSLKKAKAVRAAAVTAVASGKHSPNFVEKIRFEQLVEGLRVDYEARGEEVARSGAACRAAP